MNTSHHQVAPSISGTLSDMCVDIRQPIFIQDQTESFDFKTVCVDLTQPSFIQDRTESFDFKTVST